MTKEEFEEQADSYEMEDAYAEYLMTKTNVLIGNGTMLINAMERGACWEDFVDYMVTE